MTQNWTQMNREGQYLYGNEIHNRSQIRREPSPISVNSSTYNSVFNFDELRNNVDDLSQYVSREQRQPVQHSSENDGNHCDYSSMRDSSLHQTNLEISNVNEDNGQQYPQDDSFYNSIKVSHLSTDSSYGADVHKFTNQVDPQQRMNMVHPNPHSNHRIYINSSQPPNAYSIRPNFISGPRPQHMNGPVNQHEQHYVRLQQQKQSLEYGYSSVNNPNANCGFSESLENIGAPAPVCAKQGPPKKSVENESSSDSYFSTMNLPSSYNENGTSHTPNVRTVSAEVPEKTTRPYVTETTPPAPVKEKVKVFVTYAEERQNPDHIRTVVQISQTLFKNSIEVTVDVLEETVRAMSISDWLESNITNSDFVLICVSPSYRQVVDGQSAGFDSSQNENAVNTQYIYRRIHAEYIGSCSKNFRFIPVLISGATVQNIPPWLRDTKIFEWPKDYEDIIYRLFRQERFVKPTPGPAPQHRIERYDSCTSRQTSKSGKPSRA